MVSAPEDSEEKERSSERGREESGGPLFKWNRRNRISTEYYEI